MNSKKNEPLELKYKLIFLFIPILPITTIVGAHFKAMGYEKKARQKWNYIIAGLGFYTVAAILYVQISRNLS